MRQAPKWFPEDFQELWTNSSSTWPPSSWASKDEIDSEIPLSDSEYFQRLNPEIPYAVADQLAFSLSDLAENKNLRERIISFFFLNEYLAVPREGTYGEFIDNHWEEVHRAVLSRKVSYGAYTLQAQQVHIDEKSVLVLKSRGLKNAQQKLESLTQADFQLLLAKPYYELIAGASIAANFIDAILNKDNRARYTARDIENAFTQAFAKALGVVDPKVNYSLLHLNDSFSSRVWSCSEAFYCDGTKSRVGQIDAIEAMKFARYLQERCLILGPLRIYVLMEIFINPNIIAKGPKKDTRNFLIRLTEDNNSDEIFINLVELALNHSSSFPSGKDWLKARAAGELAMGSAELMIAMFDLDIDLEQEPTASRARLRNNVQTCYNAVKH